MMPLHMPQDLCICHPLCLERSSLPLHLGYLPSSSSHLPQGKGLHLSLYDYLNISSSLDHKLHEGRDRVCLTHH